MTLDQTEAIERIQTLVDEDKDDEGAYLYGAVLAGEDETAWYYLAIMDRSYEGNAYLNERYVLLTKPGIAESDDVDIDGDTFMKNGVNRRCGERTGKLARNLAKMYMSVVNIEEMLDDGTIDEDALKDRDPVIRDARLETEG